MSGLKVCFLDAGQGDCTLILFPDAAMTNWLVDCGSIKNGAVVGNQIFAALTRELAPRGNVIHRLILTHPDQDHYNLLSTLLMPGSPFTVQQIVYGGAIAQYQNQLDKYFTFNLLTSASAAGTALGPNATVNWSPQTIGGVQIACLAANVTAGTADTNNCSIVLMLTYNNYKFFLMGDAEAPVEAFILANWPLATLQSPYGAALKMGHHGSNTSSTQAWVQAIQPTALVVSSDTRGFGPYAVAIPARSKLNNAVTWSGRVANLPATLTHNCVVWCDDLPGSPYYQQPMLMPPTTQAVCTTLYDIQYNAALTQFVSTGGSWYFLVEQNTGAVYVEFTGV